MMAGNNFRFLSHHFRQVVGHQRLLLGSTRSSLFCQSDSFPCWCLSSMTQLCLMGSQVGTVGRAQGMGKDEGSS